MLTSTNPYTQQTIQSFNCLNNTELTEILNNCTKVYQKWSTSDCTYRKELGEKLSIALHRKKEDFAKLISSEMGKPILESIGEIEKCIELVEYYTHNFNNFLKKEIIDQNAYIQYQPTGAVLGIMPWNFPFWQVFRFAFANIMGGNLALLKHAPNTIGCAKAIEQLFTDAGFPNNVFTNLIINIEQVEQVIAHSIVQGVCVTGSTKAGSAVGMLAGKYLKKSVLELGGTDAAVILENANLEKALAATCKARMTNAGQVCIAPKRVFIAKKHLNLAIDFITKEIHKIILGNPLDKNTTMGPISDSKFLPVLEQQINKLVANGASLIKGGKINAPFFEPTLMVVDIENIHHLNDEIFGPVICLIPFETEQELLNNINKTPYGLGTAIWTTDKKKAITFSNQIESGYVSINNIVKSNVKYPFGGIKNSGYGKELGEQGFKTFLNAKTIFIEALEN